MAAPDSCGSPDRSAGESVTHPLPPPSDRLLDLARRLPLRQCVPLVPGLLATGQRDLHLGPAPLEVEGDRPDRQPAPLAPPLDLVDLRAVQQQLAFAAG